MKLTADILKELKKTRKKKLGSSLAQPKSKFK